MVDEDNAKLWNSEARLDRKAFLLGTKTSWRAMAITP